MEEGFSNMGSYQIGYTGSNPVGGPKNLCPRSSAVEHRDQNQDHMVCLNARTPDGFVIQSYIGRPSGTMVALKKPKDKKQ